MSKIQVGSKVKVVTGGKYLGKEGIVRSILMDSAKIEGNFPRSRDKKLQEFLLRNLEVIETPLQVAKTELKEVEKTINEEFNAIPANLRNIEKILPFVDAPVVGASSAEPTELSVPTTASANLGAKLAARVAGSQDNAPHLIVTARAGTGKTTTLVEGLKKVKGLEVHLIPSPQQAAVWEQMELSRGVAKTICFVAFNKSIAEELKKRVPAGCDASTMHGLGFKTVGKAFGRQVSVNQYRVENLTCEIMGEDLWTLRKERPGLLPAVSKLVSLCKMNLVGNADTHITWDEELSALASYYEVEINLRDRAEVFDLVPKVLEKCKDVRHDNAIDYDDMIWLPVVLDLPMVKYDLLLVDEAQDLNRCQQALAKKAGSRLILCGDDRQAIYGFAGADCESLHRLKEELSETPRGCVGLPLTVTRRCGKAIVRRAQQIVPDFEAFDDNPEGLVTEAVYKNFMPTVADGDMVLCRCNAPLVSTCFRFLRLGRKATIQGRDIGQGLISTVKKLKANGVADLQRKLDEWLKNENAKENAKRNPSENRLIMLSDRYDCLTMFLENATTVDEVIRKIESIFTDNKNERGVRLSSVHKAKGLEADRVFILQIEKASMPHPMARTEWAKAQEMNLLYVATTRAIHELVIVTGKLDSNREE